MIPEFFGDRSATILSFESEGQRMDIESVFRTGFIVRPEDCPLVLTLLQQWFASQTTNAQ
jgi:hypothetical protein